MQPSYNFYSSEASVSREERVGQVLHSMGASPYPQSALAWVNENFRWVDFAAVAVLQAGPPQRRLYVIEWLEAAEDIYRREHSIHSGTSAQECLAYLASTCSYYSHWPTRFVRDEAKQDFTFFHGDLVFARVYPVPSALSIPVSGSRRVQSSRIESIFLHLRHFNDPGLELVKRMSRWPGLKDRLVPERPPFNKVEKAYIPCPAEWLVAARGVAHRAGLHEPPTEQLQKLVCAIFDVPSWNHLCGLLKARQAESIDWLAQLGPFMVYSVNEEVVGFQDVYERFEDAFVEFARLSQEMSAAFDVPLALGLQGLDYNVRSLKLSAGVPAADFRGMPMPHTAWVSLVAIRKVFVDPETTERCQAVLSAGVEEGLRELLYLDLPLAQKLQRSAVVEGRQLLVSEGGWDFHLETDSSDEQHFVATLRNETGASLGTAEAPTHRGSLVPVKEGWVLANEYDGAEPVALIKSVSPATIEQLRMRFRERRRDFDLATDSKSLKAYAYLREVASAAGSILLHPPANG